MEILILIALSIIPPIVFLAYILHMDKQEPEPMGLIIKVLFAGGFSVIIAGGLQSAILKLPVFNATGFEGAALKSFLVIAPVEELIKLLVVMFIAWTNVNFNEENDGIVYTGTASLGFAMSENIMYVLESGFSVGILRALSAIPLHTFTGVLMGYYLGLAKFSTDSSKKAGNIFRGFIIAYIVHALYDSFALSGTAHALLLLPLIVGIFIFGIKFLKKGKALSTARWKNNAETIEKKYNASAGINHTPSAPSAEEKIPDRKKSGKLKAILARAIFISSGGFWFLLIIGILEDSKEGPDKLIETIAGGTILTAVPIIIAVFLEISYRRDRKR